VLAPARWTKVLQYFFMGRIEAVGRAERTEVDHRLVTLFGYLAMFDAVNQASASVGVGG
jgi:hypothetical protein